MKRALPTDSALPAGSAAALLILASLCLVQLPASQAQAADYSMTGIYKDFRGPISIPLPPTLLGVGRGVVGSGTITQTGSALPGGGPATIGLPKAVFLQDPEFGGFLIPLPQNIQLTTSVSHSGPTIPLTLMAGRSGLGTFSYCPGATANPNCTTVAAGGSQGTLDGIIRYSAGPNKFGGTFKMLVNGIATLTNKGDALPPTVMTAMGATKAALPFSAINFNLGGGSVIAAGQTYGAMIDFTPMASPATHPYGYMSTPRGLLSRGPFVDPGYDVVNSNTGFPMTTGQIYLYRKIGAQAVDAVPSKKTVTGYDKRTANGAGRILMVAGSLSRTYPTDGSDPPEGSVPNHATLKLTMIPQPALPLTSPATLLTLGILILLTAGYAVARRDESA